MTEGLNRPVVVLVEDDAGIAEMIEFNLQNEGYATRSFRDGKSLFKELAELPSVSLFILDLMLPDMDGFEICARLRKDSQLEWVPIMMLTARSAESDKVRGLEAGADDYLTKPFGIREFLARVQALIRRYRKLSSLRDQSQHEQILSGRGQQMGPGQLVDRGQLAGLGPLDSGELAADHPARPAAATTAERISSGSIVLDDTRHRVFKDGVELEMTHREYELLKFLMLHRGVAYSRDDLLNYVWGYEYSGETRTVDVHIRQLRRKIEEDDANPLLIETVRGRGYRFSEN
ncbi:MAG: two component transcriptional regulator, winged helix family [Firmicutes bacterium]|nr:two component transcriptional regulator, winged helix family [Bacillota bacterium]